jgi:hypothetical protein
MPTTQVITLDQTVRLLASSDAELLGSQSSLELSPELYASLSFALIEFVALVSSPRAASWATLPKIWRIYKDAKKRLQKTSGSLLARSLNAAGGRGICDRVDYCRNKARLKELFDFADSPEGAKVFAEGTEAAMKSEYAEDIKKLQEILGEAAEAIGEATKEIAEEVADNVVPISFVFMSVKYGLDELCACCDECDGIGSLGTKECPKCDGKGHFRVN